MFSESKARGAMTSTTFSCGLRPIYWSLQSLDYLAATSPRMSRSVQQWAVPWLRGRALLLSRSMSFVRAFGSLILFVVLTAACASNTQASGPAPFDAVLIELFGTDNTDAYLVETERDAAKLVMACMNNAGFEFQMPPLTDPLDPPEPMDLEAAHADGFGIIAGFRFQLSEFDASIPQGYDPNLAYASTLSLEEFQRFFFTLNGPEAEPGQLQEGGCNSQSSNLAYADWLRFTEALPNFRALGEERDTHPDWLAAQAQWRSCMLDRGFDYAEPDAIRTDAFSRMRDTVNEVYPGGQVPLIETDGDFMVDPKVDILLNELSQFERSAAVANIECTEPVAQHFHKVERLVQQAFVDRNQETIDELLVASR